MPEGAAVEQQGGGGLAHRAGRECGLDGVYSGGGRPGRHRDGLRAATTAVLAKARATRRAQTVPRRFDPGVVKGSAARPKF